MKDYLIGHLHPTQQATTRHDLSWRDIPDPAVFVPQKL